MAAGDPILRVVLALTAIHALGAEKTRRVRRDDIDLPAERIHLRGIDLIMLQFSVVTASAAPRPLDRTA